MPLLLDNEGNRYFIGARHLWAADHMSPTLEQTQNLWLLSPHWRQVDTLPLPLWCAFAVCLLVHIVVVGLAMTVLVGSRVDPAILSAAFLFNLAYTFLSPQAGRFAGRRVYLGEPLHLPLSPQIFRSWTEYAATMLGALSFGLILLAQAANRTVAGTPVSDLPLSVDLGVGILVTVPALILPLWFLLRSVMRRFPVGR